MLRTIKSNLSPHLYWSSVVRATKLEGLKLVKAKPSLLGWKLLVRLSTDIPPELLVKCSERIAVFFECARVRVLVHEDNFSLADIYVDYVLMPPAQSYPHDLKPVWLPSPPATPIPFFYTDEGKPVNIALHGSSLLLGGNPGSGKSTAIRVLLNGLAQQRNTALFGIDPKSVELAPWVSRFTQLIKGDNPDATKQLLEFLLELIHDRAEYMSENGLMTLKPSRDFPSVVLIVDEWAEMGATGTKLQRQDIHDLLRRYVSLGRAVGCSAVLATQRPTGDTIDPGTRALLAHRLAFRCGDKWQSEAILGMGHHEPTTISLKSPGNGFYSDGTGVQGVKVYDFPESQIEPCPVLRIEKDELSPRARPELSETMRDTTRHLKTQ